MLESQCASAPPLDSIALPDPSGHPTQTLKLSAEAAEYVRVRMDQEMLAIDSERDRLLQAMNHEILHVKQRMLYDICGRMQEFAHTDDPTLAHYQELYPDVFCRFSQKGTRQKMRRKPRLPKPLTDVAASERPMPRTDLLFDLSGRLPRARENPPAADDVALMTTQNRQRWVVRRSNLGNHIAKLTYCDGSSSLLTDSDAKTLGVSFSPVARK
jgi:hypothetical protein